MEDREQRLREVARIALKLEHETGCPAQLMIAQWALDSKWGAKPAGEANFFGIKAGRRHEKCCTVTTREVIARIRRAEPSVCRLRLAQGFLRDYARFITNGIPYHARWGAGIKDSGMNTMIAGVARVCATDPNYARLATVIIRETNVAGSCAILARA